MTRRFQELKQEACLHRERGCLRRHNNIYGGSRSERVVIINPYLCSNTLLSMKGRSGQNSQRFLVGTFGFGEVCFCFHVLFPNDFIPVLTFDFRLSVLDKSAFDFSVLLCFRTSDFTFRKRLLDFHFERFHR
jgi:hypothetical protein